MASTPDRPKPETRPPKPELKDLGIRLLLIPAFGIVIPHLTGLFGPFGPSTLTHWLGYPWFILLSASIWHGNRYFLLKQREHFDWFNHPVRKITVLVFANIIWTAPLTAAMLRLWYRWAGFGPDWAVIETVALMNVICVLFITHVYETVYLIRQRESDLVAVLKAQLDPHFLFNSLNTLSWLIRNHPEQAARFNDSLADVYRYILLNHNRELVLLGEELDFLDRYNGLLSLRFGAAIEIRQPEWNGERDRFLVPPLSLQVLLENAVKHNEIAEDRPLPVEIRQEGRWLVMENGLRPKSTARPGAQVGLRNLDERCRMLLGRGLDVNNDGQRFRVRIPVEPCG